MMPSVESRSAAMLMRRRKTAVDRASSMSIKEGFGEAAVNRNGLGEVGMLVGKERGM